MLKLIRKDLLLIFATKINLLVIILFAPMMNLIIGKSDPEHLIAVSIIAFGYILNSISFSYNITTKPYLLIQSLPIKKIDLVISKYISTIINCILAVIFTGGYLWIISLFGLPTVDSFNISLIIDILTILLLGLSISLPVNFILSAKGANTANVLIMIALMNIKVMGSNGIMHIFNPNEWVNFKVVIIAAIVYLLSMLTSIWAYERKDLI